MKQISGRIFFPPSLSLSLPPSCLILSVQLWMVVLIRRSVKFSQSPSMCADLSWRADRHLWLNPLLYAESSPTQDSTEGSGKGCMVKRARGNCASYGRLFVLPEIEVIIRSTFALRALHLHRRFTLEQNGVHGIYIIAPCSSFKILERHSVEFSALPLMAVSLKILI